MEMEWLTQNWTWLVLLFGFVLLMSRGGMGCGIGHSPAHRDADRDRGQDTPPTSIKDPMSGETIAPASAVTSDHGGRIYYFASRENRDRFEAQTERYASRPSNEIDGQQHAHRRHAGC